MFRRAPEPVAIATILAVSLAPLVFRSCLSALFNRAASVSLTCLKVMIVAGDIDFFLRENQTIALRLLSDESENLTLIHIKQQTIAKKTDILLWFVDKKLFTAAMLTLLTFLLYTHLGLICFPTCVFLILSWVSVSQSLQRCWGF